MPIRISGITLEDSNPVGPYSVSDLHSSDLVIVVGANGAGKSCLFTPFNPKGKSTWGSLRYRIGATDVDDEPPGVSDAATFIRSHDLVEEILSLGGALDGAVNTTRLDQEGRLLEVLFNRLTKEAEQTPPTEPAELSLLREQFLAADRQCGVLPRTEEAYEELGRDLARRAGIEWQAQPVDAADRADNEAKLTPSLRTMEGASDVVPILGELGAVQTGSAQQVEAGDRALRELSLRVATSHQQPTTATAEELCDRLVSKENSLTACIDAKDHLAACRRSARAYLQAERVAAHLVEKCPVCLQRVEADGLEQRLDHAPVADGAADAETVGWLRERTRVQDDRRQLESQMREFQAARERADRVHRAIFESVARLSGRLSLNPPTNWDADVRAIATELRLEFEAWQTQHTVPSVNADTALDELKAKSRAAQTNLQERGNQLNADLKSRESDFKAFKSLGALLVARAALNAVVWSADAARDDALARRRVHLSRWIKVVQDMVTDRKTRVRSARQDLVNSEQLKADFNRLVGELVTRHPEFDRLSFHGDCVQRDGVEVEKFSDGQTVLINLAAVVAVAGATARAGDDRAGWMVFDEPTTALDEAAISSIAEYLGCLSVSEFPVQMFVATFNSGFAERLRERARRAGRTVRVIQLPQRAPHQVRPGLQPTSDNIYAPIAQ